MSPTAAHHPCLLVNGREVPISNPDKVLWDEPLLTKAAFLEKLIGLSPYLLDYCRNRYLTTIRFPDGYAGKSFYQKNAPEPIPDFVRTETAEGIRYVVMDDLPTLLWLGNLACLEFHPSFHPVADPLPCEWIIDLDPTVEPDPRVAEAALEVGQVLRSLRIESVPKTSGATGIQIYVPIERRYTFEQLRSIGAFVSRYLTERRPDLFTLERLKKDRGTLIYIDYLQHWRGKTLSAPYTPRARRHAPVSTPLEWGELKRPFRPEQYNLETVFARLDEHGDLIRSVKPQSLDHVLSAL